MRFFFTGPRIFGIRPGVILGASDFRKAFAPSVSRSNMTGSFVYVIEGQAGHHKIGVSRDPIQRLAELQTGSPVPLRFAFIGVTPGTGYNIEGFAHNLLEQQKVLNEWFAVPASIAIGATLEAASRLGEPIQQVQPEIVPQIIYLANQSGTAAPKGTVKVRDLVMSAMVVGAWILLAYLRASSVDRQPCAASAD